MTKNEAIELAINLIEDTKLPYYQRQEPYLSGFGKQRFEEYKEAITILEGLKDEKEG